MMLSWCGTELEINKKSFNFCCLQCDVSFMQRCDDDC